MELNLEKTLAEKYQFLKCNTSEEDFGAILVVKTRSRDDIFKPAGQNIPLVPNYVLKRN